MHHDHIERILSIARTLDHLLEDGPAIVTGGGTGFDERGDDRVAMGCGPRILIAGVGPGSTDHARLDDSSKRACRALPAARTSNHGPVAAS
jgi:hypothetical protein